MKLAIVGGGGVRVPLLVHGLISRGLPFDRVALFDIDPARAELMAQIAGARVPQTVVSTHDAIGPALDGADFVVTSVRAGGLEAREHDEAAALAHGLVGQETVGPAGFAMAVRNVRALAGCARDIARHAPSAWVINFTNPVGIVSQAMARAADIKVIGVCDTPTELFAEIAQALQVRPEECVFDYVGLNHLGWVREVTHRGRPLLRDIWRDEDLLSRIYARPLFPAAYLSTLRLLPSEYVFFYAFPDRAVANIRAAGRTRGAAVRTLTADLFAALADHPRDRIRAYDQYLAERSGSYMQIESGEQAPRGTAIWADLTGYDRIAFDVISAIVHDRNVMIPLDVANAGSLPELAAGDVVEVPCAVGAQGPRPLEAGPLPEQVRALVVQVKAYERATIDAAMSPTRDALVAALARNPLVSSTAVAAALVDRLRLS